MQKCIATGQMSKARRNKNVFSFDLKVFRQLHSWIFGVRPFHTTGAHTLKERLHDDSRCLKAKQDQSFHYLGDGVWVGDRVTVAGLARCRPGFFSSGNTWAVLNNVGNVPSENEQLVTWASSGANTSAHDFSNDVRSMSRGEDLFGNKYRDYGWKRLA